ncbi:MAG: YdcF family protein [Alphaproteobacteria bacterium]
MIKRALILIAVLGVIWLTGLVVFVGYVDAMHETDGGEAVDAIVVLTGGSERVATGVDLLRRGLGKKLFISGVAPGVEPDKILNDSALAPEQKSCCVILGYRADDTIGNAEETLQWLRRENYRSMRLVTAHYHMLRSLLEFRMLDSGVRIIPHPVAPVRVQLDGWWARGGTARLLMTEYNKLIVTMARTIVYGVLK